MIEEINNNIKLLQASFVNIANILEKLCDALSSEPCSKELPNKNEPSKSIVPKTNYTVNDIRKLFVAAAQNGHKDEIISVLHSFGVDRVSQLQESSFPEIIEIVKMKKIVEANILNEIQKQ